ncbi:Pentafunctional AROM polypeptide [Fusarium oxysporum f. sp. albedinis]|nr:Pentafunctional AROM polypeptide [Fusarium oxysporum f. sp. albedinis]
MIKNRRSTALSQVRPRETPTNVLALDGRQCGFIDLCPIPKNAQNCLEAPRFFSSSTHTALPNARAPMSETE